MRSGRPAGVNEILHFLIGYCSLLWDQGRYRIADSGTTTSFGGDAYVIIESASLRMRFVRDRGQLFLDFQETVANERDPWYSVDLVRHLLTGERPASAELSADYGEFLRESLPEIERRFSDDSVAAATKHRLNELKRLRAKELFG
jgi:hypothetical protein